MKTSLRFHSDAAPAGLDSKFVSLSPSSELGRYCISSWVAMQNRNRCELADAFRGGWITMGPAENETMSGAEGINYQPGSAETRNAHWNFKDSPKRPSLLRFIQETNAPKC
jgi:hypothetical protein